MRLKIISCEVFCRVPTIASRCFSEVKNGMPNAFAKPRGLTTTVPVGLSESVAVICQAKNHDFHGASGCIWPMDTQAQRHKGTKAE